LIAGAGLFLGRHAQAADHLDGPSATNDPAADITDLYAWMSSDASKIDLVMNVSPFAGSDATFSDAVQYVFHTTANTVFGGRSNPKDIICTFTTAQAISCWLGTQEYVTGDASTPAGLSSSDNKFKVFAGPRNDPFFFNLHGFHTAVATVQAVAGGLTFDAAGCPAVDPGSSALLVGQLSHDSDGGPAYDNFGGSNVLSLVVEVDKTLLTGGSNDLVSVWASTNQIATP